jgi:hypothetical protein
LVGTPKARKGLERPVLLIAEGVRINATHLQKPPLIVIDFGQIALPAVNFIK